jgi:hypothetical protein
VLARVQMLFLGDLLAELQKAAKVIPELRESLQQIGLMDEPLFAFNHYYIVSRCIYPDQKQPMVVASTLQNVSRYL